MNTSLLGGNPDDDSETVKAIVAILDRAGIEKYDMRGKRLFVQSRVEQALWRLDLLAKHLLEQRPIKDRIAPYGSGGTGDPIDHVLAEHFCAAYQCTKASKNSDAWKDVGEDMVKRLKEHGVYSHFYTDEP